MKEFKYNLKDNVYDSVTAFSGTITARSQFISGSNRYQLEANDNAGRPIEWWFDEERLVKVS